MLPAKTGTTDENYDRWLCGFTPYYTAVTWYGYDQNETVEFNNRNPAGLLWANVMSRIHAGLETAKFEKPNTVSSATVCASTGKRAREGCKDTYTEYFLMFTVPSLCDEHTGDEIDKNNASSSNNSSLTNSVQNIIQGITNDIDAIDPQESQRENITVNTNLNTINTVNTTNTTNINNRIDMINTNTNSNSQNTISNNSSNNNTINSNTNIATNSATQNTSSNNTNTQNISSNNSLDRES